MIEDCFMAWYEKQWPELDPSTDDFYWSARAAYYAGWKRHMEIEEALTELARLGEQEINLEDSSS